MLDNKRPTPILAVLGACTALMLTSAPAFAQAPATPAPAAAPADNNTAAPAAPAADSGLANGGTENAPSSIKHSGSLNPVRMFFDANIVVKVVMIGLLLASVVSWTLLILKLLEFGRLSGQSNRFVEAFRGA